MLNRIHKWIGIWDEINVMRFIFLFIASCILLFFLSLLSSLLCCDMNVSEARLCQQWRQQQREQQDCVGSSNTQSNDKKMAADKFAFSFDLFNNFTKYTLNPEFDTQFWRC